MSEDNSNKIWMYIDDDGIEQGPFDTETMKVWYDLGYFCEDDQIKLVTDDEYYKIGSKGADNFIVNNNNEEQEGEEEENNIGESDDIVKPLPPPPLPRRPSMVKMTENAPPKVPPRVPQKKNRRTISRIPDDVLTHLSHRLVTKTNDELKHKKVRQMVVKELLETEQTYIENLHILLELYVKPLKDVSSERISLPAIDIKCLFSNIATLVTLNENLLQSITERVELWMTQDESEQCMGDIFVEFAPYFKMYKQYIDNHKKATMKLIELSVNKKWVTFIDEQSKHPKAKSNTIESFLIMPIQRIPRYKLLLTELLKNTDDGHQDRPALLKAVKSIDEVAISINEHVKQSENRQVIFDLQRQFFGNLNLIAPHRRLLRQGPLQKITHDTKKTYQFFLFTDLMLYATKHLGKYHCQMTVNVDSSFCIDTNIPGEYAEVGFQIINGRKSFIVAAINIQEKQHWLDAFKECIESYKRTIPEEERSKIIELQNPSSVQECPSCDRGFGIMRHKYHCKQCGKVVCSQCSSQRRTINDEIDQRVCDLCYPIDNNNNNNNNNNANNNNAVESEPVFVKRTNSLPVISRKQVSDSLYNRRALSERSMDIELSGTIINNSMRVESLKKWNELYKNDELK